MQGAFANLALYLHSFHMQGAFANLALYLHSFHMQGAFANLALYLSPLQVPRILHYNGFTVTLSPIDFDPTSCICRMVCTEEVENCWRPET